MNNNPYMNEYPVVHIYGQHSHHMEAIIIGNKEGLQRLVNSLNYALEKIDNTGVIEVFCNDGEGYSISIKMVSKDVIDKLPVPYTADYAQDETGIEPSSFLK